MRYYCVLPQSHSACPQPHLPPWRLLFPLYKRHTHAESCFQLMIHGLLTQVTGPYAGGGRQCPELCLDSFPPIALHRRNATSTGQTRAVGPMATSGCV